MQPLQKSLLLCRLAGLGWNLAGLFISTLWLSGISDKITLSRWRLWHHFMHTRLQVLPLGECTRSICSAICSSIWQFLICSTFVLVIISAMWLCSAVCFAVVVIVIVILCHSMKMKCSFVWTLLHCYIAVMWECLQNPAIADVYTEHSVQTTTAKYSPSGFYIASAGWWFPHVDPGK